jgi:hypothetical protein
MTHIGELLSYIVVEYASVNDNEVDLANAHIMAEPPIYQIDK